MKLDPLFWSGRRVFLTGNTGFKGSWMSIWLKFMGAEVRGFALEPPSKPNLYELTNCGNDTDTTKGDIRDFSVLSRALNEFNPSVVIHMAAQPLVRLSYTAPLSTFETNVMGTANLLEACRSCKSVQAIVNVTTDKCYENREWVWGYRETDPMGGSDPYSASKGCAELVTTAFRRSFFETEGSPTVCSARAGNVIGGGDWADDRLLPDIFRALKAGEELQIRYPQATRPWQHVLEPLHGYLLLAQHAVLNPLLADGAWNFGPRDEDILSVGDVVKFVGTKRGDLKWSFRAEEVLHEATLLKLDISKAVSQLRWTPKWGVHESIARVVDWHSGYDKGLDPLGMCLEQVEEFQNIVCGG